MQKKSNDEFKFDKLIVHGLPKCNKCKKKSTCDTADEIKTYVKTLRKKFHVKVTIGYTDDIVIIGYIGKEENLVSFWVEAILNTGHRVLFVPPTDTGYVCTELPDEHTRSYL